MKYNIHSSSIAEALSIPIQQTTRYVYKHKDEISQAEWELYDEVFTTRDLDLMYDAGCSDNPKRNMKNGLNLETLKKYSKLLSIQFLNHPETYIESVIHSTYGYFYIGKSEYYGLGFQTYNDAEVYNSKNLDIKNNENFSETRKKFAEFLEKSSINFLVSYIYRPSLYINFLVILIITLLCYKKYSGLFMFVMPVFTIIICCLSPLNGALRYAFPICACLPILTAYTYKSIHE